MVTVVRVDPAQRSLVGDFVALGRTLNPDGDQHPGAERSFLTGRHPLSHTLRLEAFMAMDRHRPVGRIGVSLPHGSDHALIGFLQTPDDPSVSAALFDRAHQVAGEAGRGILVGGVDGSFWHRYRVKVTGFERPAYFTEPVNPPHHLAAWTRAGYREWESYLTSFYAPATADMDLRLFQRRHQRFTDQGYRFEHPDPRDWDRTLADLHTLFQQTFRDLPLFTDLDLATFRALFSRLTLVADPSMIWLGRRDGVTESFLVTLPDHGLGLQHGNPATRLVRAWRGRRHADHYVHAYQGTLTPGLGTAVTHELFEQTLARGASVIGSLMRSGAASRSYARAQVVANNDYLLLRREL